jgi:hypothetical protein
MDPYLESQGFWQDFHFRLIAAVSDALSSDLPGTYAALIEERISLVDLSGEPHSAFRPDVAIAPEDRGSSPRGASRPVATLEPVSLPLAREQFESATGRWIEIKRLPDLSLVTVIEILSPTNKSGAGRAEYLQKRWQILDQPVYLVEIDLLLNGSGIRLGAPFPTGDYFTLVSRSNQRDNCDVYAWSVRHALPTVPIPLLRPDPDIPLDLATVAARAYDQGRYGRLVNYATPIDLTSLAPVDREWAATQLHLQ